MLDLLVEHYVIFYIKIKAENVSVGQFQIYLDSADANGLVSTRHVKNMKELPQKSQRRTLACAEFPSDSLQTKLM